MEFINQDQQKEELLKSIHELYFDKIISNHRPSQNKEDDL